MYADLFVSKFFDAYRACRQCFAETAWKEIWGKRTLEPGSLNHFMLWGPPPPPQRKQVLYLTAELNAAQALPRRATSVGRSLLSRGWMHDWKSPASDGGRHRVRERYQNVPGGIVKTRSRSLSLKSRNYV